ncbi:MAG: ureidoglycolate lyase [Acidimicrobiales bacterium]
MTSVSIHTVRAEALEAEAFAPFGQVLGASSHTTRDAVIELREGEVFHLNVLSYERRPLRCDHLNAHHNATQALFALGGKPTLLVVAPAGSPFTTPGDLAAVRAFVCDGTAGVNLALGTWHWGPYPIAEHVALLNLQGAGFADDNEVAHIERDLGTVVEVLL